MSKKVFTTKDHACKGCGRLIIKHSVVERWDIWIRFGTSKPRPERWWFCSDCSKIANHCEKLGKLYRNSGWVIRTKCIRCDSFPLCEKVNYLRESNVGDIYLGAFEVDRKAAREKVKNANLCSKNK